MTKAESDSVRDQVARALEVHSVHALHKILGVGREQILRIVAGMPVRKGTVLVVRENLPRLTSDAA